MSGSQGQLSAKNTQASSQGASSSVTATKDDDEEMAITQLPPRAVLAPDKTEGWSKSAASGEPLKSLTSMPRGVTKPGAYKSSTASMQYKANSTQPTQSSTSSQPLVKRGNIVSGAEEFAGTGGGCCGGGGTDVSGGGGSGGHDGGGGS